MKNSILILALGFTLGACKNNSTHNPSSPANTVSAAAKVQIDSVSGKELSAKFGIDIEEKHFYKGFYTCSKDAAGKEILQGEFEIKSLGEIDYDNAESVESFSSHQYQGRYEQGSKEGVFSCEGSYYEAHEQINLVFSNNQCTEASYEGQAEGYCSSYKGKLDNCTFSEAAQKAAEIECDFN